MLCLGRATRTRSGSCHSRTLPSGSSRPDHDLSTYGLQRGLAVHKGGIRGPSFCPGPAQDGGTGVMTPRKGADDSTIRRRVPRPSSRSRALLTNLGLLVVSSVAALTIGEAGVRVFVPFAREQVVPPGMFEIDKGLGWVLASDWSGVHRSRYFEAEYRLNHLGFRDPERQIGRAPGRYRILVYGDSQVFGWGQSLGERFTNLLETRSAEMEVWNLAVPGYGLDQEILAYETHGVEYDADEVVFFVDNWTLYRIPFDYMFRKPKPRFRLDDAGQLLVDPVDARIGMTSNLLYRVLSPFYLPYFLERQLATLRYRAARPTPTESSPRRLNELTRRILLRAKAQADAQGQRMSILTDFTGPAGFPALFDFAEENEIGVLRIELDSADHGLIFGPSDSHWTPHAARLIAEQLWRQFQDRPPRGRASSTARPDPAH